MKNFKMFVWIAVLLIIQTVTAHYIRIFDVAPLVLLPFAVAAALLEDNFSYAEIIGVICGLCAGTFTGRNFFISVFAVTFTAVAVMNLRERPRYVNNIWKMLFWTAAVTFIWEALEYFMLYHSFSGYGRAPFSKTVLLIIYNSLLSFIIYPLLRKTVYNKEEKKKLII